MDRKFTSLLVLSLSVVLICPLEHRAPPLRSGSMYIRRGCAVEEIIAEFEAENPDIKIVVETVPHDQYIPKLLTAMTSGGDQTF